LNVKLSALFIAVFLISTASAALTAEVNSPAAGTIINSSTASTDINFNVTYDGNSGLTAGIYLDNDTDFGNGTQATITTGLTAVTGNNSFNWDASAEDGTHYIYVQISDGNENGNDYSESFITDKNPPVTTATGFTDNAWTKTKPLTVTLNCNDAGTGCKKIKYKLNDANWTEINGNTANFAINTEGTHLLQVYSVDNLDQNETDKNYTIKIDSIAPTIPIIQSASANQLTITLNWTASTDDVNGSGIKTYYVFRKDGNNSFNFLKDAGNTTTTQDTKLIHGTTYTYYIIASDNADNNSTKSNDSNAVTVYDTTGPSVLSNANSDWHNSNQDIIITCTDTDGTCQTIYWKLNAGSESPYSGTQTTVSVSTEGENTLEFWAKDDHENEGTHVTATVRIDKSTPNAPSLNSPGANSNGEVSLSWSQPSDNPGANSGIKGYKIYRKTGSESYSNIATVTGQSTTSYTDTGRSQGTTYYYKITATDNLDHESDLSNSNEQQVTIPSDSSSNTSDSIAPSVSWNSPKDKDIIKDINVTLKAYISDATSELKFISFTYKKSSDSTYSSIKSLQQSLINGYHSAVWDTSGLENGEYDLKVLGRDSPGNVGTKIITVTLDRENIGTTDKNTEQEKTEDEIIAEEYINQAKESQTKAKDLINYCTEHNIYFSSDERITEGNSLLKEAETALEENRIINCINDANKSKQYFDEFYSETSIKVYNEEIIKSEDKELNLEGNLSKENETLKKEITTTREMQLMQITTKDKSYYQQNIVLTIRNESEETKTFQLIEIIPKQLIESTELIKSNIDFTAIQEDPIIQWEITLDAGETKEIIYSLDKELTQEEADKIIKEKSIELFEGNSILLETKTKINKNSFKNTATGFFLFDNFLAIGTGILVIIVLAGIFFFVKGKNISFGSKEEDNGFDKGLAGAYSQRFSGRKTLREETPKKRFSSLRDGESGRFSYKGD